MLNTTRNDSFALRFLYDTALGRLVLKPLSSRTVSRVCGSFLDSKASKPLIKRFVKKYDIDLSEYENEDYKSFNAFFTRRINPAARPIDAEPASLIAPCDGFLSAYRITENTVIPVKQSRYTISSLLGGDPVARKFLNGICLVYRLCVDNYHRYCYLDSGKNVRKAFIKGRLHTVRPIALERLPVFTENCREYTVMKTDNFGEVVQIEVGAMLVGKIRNHQVSRFSRGDEKGMFLYGGSTVIILLQDGSAHIPEDVFRSTEEGLEIPIKMGQKIGQKQKHPAGF